MTSEAENGLVNSESLCLALPSPQDLRLVLSVQDEIGLVDNFVGGLVEHRLVALDRSARRISWMEDVVDQQVWSSTVQNLVFHAAISLVDLHSLSWFL